MSSDQMPQWDVPGWDWAPYDYAWLSSKSGIHQDGTSIFFIHGGSIRHQAHIPFGSYSVDEFCALLRDRAEGLDDPSVRWIADTGGGDPDLWVEGTRAPNETDLARLQAARDRQRRIDEHEIRRLRRIYPNNFGLGGTNE